MASLNDSSTPFSRQTALSDGETFQAKYGKRTPAPLENTGEAAIAGWEHRIRALEEGRVPLDQLRHDDIDMLIETSTRVSAQNREDIGKQILQGSTMADRVSRAVQTAIRTPATTTRDLEADRVALHSAIDRQRQIGADFRENTGLGLAKLRGPTANLIDGADRIAATVDVSTAAMVQSEARFAPGIRLFSRLVSGPKVPNLRAAVEDAVLAVSKEQLKGDSWIFGSKEDRIEAVMLAASKLADEHISPVERAVLSQTLFLAIAAEAVPSAAGLQMMLDMMPFVGQYRAVQRADKSANAARKAFAAGDIGEGALQSAMVAFEVLGAIGGGVTPVVATGSRTFRSTVSREASVGLRRGREFLDARRVGGREAAQLRAQEFARRAVGEQLEGIDRQAYSDFLTRMAPGREGKLRYVVTQAIGDAGELFFEPILQRWRPGTLSEARAKKMEMLAEKTGRDDLLEKAKEMRESLKISRDGRNARLDAKIGDVMLIKDPDGVKFIHAEVDKNGKPFGIDVKTGKIDWEQLQVYKHNANPEISTGEPPSITGIAFLHVYGNEWRTVLRKTLRVHVNNYAKNNNISNQERDKIYSEILNIFEVADIKQWATYFGVENYLAAELRAVMGQISNEE